tara:strand:- start:448 stop:927 length:480 start_codon:yes stop_codon:yes gene_type:complete
MNKEYYSVRAAKIKKWLKYMDIFLAIFASGSAVLSFGLWNESILGFPIGPTMLGAATSMAIIIGIARPYLKLEDEYERLSSIQGAYSAIAYVMSDIVTKVKTEQDVADDSYAVYSSLRQVRGSLQPNEDTPSDSKLIEEMQTIVNRRYPTTFFYYPDEP